MSLIKKIGKLCAVDDEGYVMNDSRLDNVREPFLQVVKEIKEAYLAHAKDHIHSIYIRGSVPKGIAIEGTADIDTLAITCQDPKLLDLSWMKAEEARINQQYDCVSGVELAFYSLDEIMETERFSMMSFILKTHGVCIWGEDVAERLPTYKPDQTIANQHLFYLQEQICSARADLVDNEEEDIKDCCRWIMKMIVRAGLALVMVEENTYSRDLYPCYELFSIPSEDG